VSCLNFVMHPPPSKPRRTSRPWSRRANQNGMRPNTNRGGSHRSACRYNLRAAGARSSRPERATASSPGCDRRMGASLGFAPPASAPGRGAGGSAVCMHRIHCKPSRAPFRAQNFPTRKPRAADRSADLALGWTPSAFQAENSECQGNAGVIMPFRPNPENNHYAAVSVYAQGHVARSDGKLDEQACGKKTQIVGKSNAREPLFKASKEQERKKIKGIPYR
jgi:hypothetical protein